MKPMTIKELSESLKSIVRQGYGDYILLVSDDEECNGFHGIYQKEFAFGEDLKYLNEKNKKNEIGKTICLY